jgi:hypothetical protein
VQVVHSYADLVAAQERLMTVEARPLGVVVNGIGIDVVANSLRIDILVLNRATVDFIERHVEGVAYGTHAALVPVDAQGQPYPGPGSPRE